MKTNFFIALISLMLVFQTAYSANNSIVLETKNVLWGSLADNEKAYKIVERILILRMMNVVDESIWEKFGLPLDVQVLENEKLKGLDVDMVLFHYKKIRADIEEYLNKSHSTLGGDDFLKLAIVAILTEKLGFMIIDNEVLVQDPNVVSTTPSYANQGVIEKIANILKNPIPYNNNNIDWDKVKISQIIENRTEFNLYSEVYLKGYPIPELQDKITGFKDYTSQELIDILKGIKSYPIPELQDKLEALNAYPIPELQDKVLPLVGYPIPELQDKVVGLKEYPIPELQDKLEPFKSYIIPELHNTLKGLSVPQLNNIFIIPSIESFELNATFDRIKLIKQ